MTTTEKIMMWLGKRASKATAAQLREMGAKSRAAIQTPTAEASAGIAMIRRDIPAMAEVQGDQILTALADAADAIAATR